MSRLRKVPRRLQRSLPFMVLAAIALALLMLPLYSDEVATNFNVYNSLQSFSSLGLLALGVGLSMIAGEFDLSTIGMYALGGMLAVQLGGGSPELGVLVAIGAGLVVGAIQGGVIVSLKISSVPVTLGGYIALLGLTSVISGGKSIAYDNLDAGLWLERVTLTFFSPRSLIAIGVFLVIAGLLKWTRMGRDLRAVGGDRRASRAAGVRTGRVLIATFMASASLSALGGALLAFSVATAAPDPGVTPFIFAITAALLGGVTLAGGQGSVIGIAVGAISLALLQELFVILAAPDYVSKLVLGSLLVLVVAIDAPDLRRAVVATRARLGSSPGAPEAGAPLATPSERKG
jgi:ribose/xylose/arabinose/galactoside ABC-type transport system permease subunit